ncbi:hypothetical protein F6B41_12290 [Microbacterium lushaniae]|nr:hypothetical protein F6B41_12290 [Microbacterium lushaniae]
MIAVHLDGQSVRVPAEWEISFGSSQGRDMLYARDPGTRVLHVFVIDADGRLRELQGLPPDLIEDLVGKHFGVAGR